MRRRVHTPYPYEKEGVKIAPFLALFFLTAVRFLYFGFRYFPQLDDYIQHHNYAKLGTFLYVIQKLGLLAARPLAGILDITLWSWLWNHAIVGVLLLSALYALTAEKFYRLFAHLFGTGPFFVVLFFMPLGIEGTYWMSASTRVIPGLFFAALSAEQLCRYLYTNEKRRLLFAFLFQLVTFGFYEQAAVLSCALDLALAVWLTREGNGRLLPGFIGFGSAAVHYLLTTIAGESALYSGRTQLVSVFSASYFQTFLPELLSQFRSAFLGGGYYIFVHGFLRGILRIFADGAWIYCLLIFCGCIWFAKTHPAAKKRGKIGAAFLLGVFLTVAAVLPFFAIANPWFSLRGTVPAFVGIALMSDALIRLISRENRKAVMALCGTVALVFCICAASEIGDYHDNWESDQEIIAEVGELAERHQKGDSVMLLNLDGWHSGEQNCKYHEHITGVTESSWALTGAVRCKNENVYEGITYVPVSLRRYSAGEIYRAWEYEEKTISKMAAVYWYHPTDHTLEPLSVTQIGADAYELTTRDGTYIGVVLEKEKIGYFIEE